MYDSADMYTKTHNEVRRHDVAKRMLIHNDMVTKRHTLCVFSFCVRCTSCAVVVGNTKRCCSERSDFDTTEWQFPFFLGGGRSA